jgi:hypothetical protein
LRRRSRWIVLTVLSVVIAACGAGEDSSTTTTTTPTTTTLAPGTTQALPTTTTLAPGTTTTTSPPTTTISETTTTTSSSGLPGEPIDFGPNQGDILAVIGVAHDDVLNLRAKPGASQEIVAGIPPTYADLVALGETRQLPGAMWIAVDYGTRTGWVNLRYIGYLGATTDETATIVANLGSTPTAETMLELGRIVAESLASDEPASDIVVSVAPSVGDLGEVTYDVIGLGDDAVRGLRLHVFGQPIDEGFSLKTVEMTTLCGRGADADGACV